MERRLVPQERIMDIGEIVRRIEVDPAEPVKVPTEPAQTPTEPVPDEEPAPA